MLDLNSRNGGELAERLEALPKEAKNFLASDEFDKKLSELKEKYFLLDELEEGGLLERLVLLLALNFIKPVEFAPEINRFIYIDNSEAIKIADELLGVLWPVLSIQVREPKVPELKPGSPLPSSAPREVKLSVPYTRPVAEPRTVTIKPIGLPPLPTQAPEVKQGINPEAKTQPTPFAQMKPAAVPAAAQAPLRETSPTPAPFIIHERKEPDTRSMVQSNIPPLMRPSFSKDATPTTMPRPPLVQTQASTNQLTPGEKARVVNYSAPKIPLETQTAAQNSSISFAPPQPPKPAVNPDNVIDLKDLPK